MNPTDCRSDFGGTSSATPLVAGVIALMLQANSKLTWRDVQVHFFLKPHSYFLSFQKRIFW